MISVRVGDLVAAPDKKNAAYVVEDVKGTWATVRDGVDLRTFSAHSLRVINGRANDDGTNP